MATKLTPKQPNDPQLLSAMEFRKFLEYCPDVILKRHNVPGGAFWGVGMALAQHINYATGQKSRLSQRGIAAISRTTPRTTKVVLDFLKAQGVIVVVDHQRRNGKLSENYSFRKSPFVREVLKLANQHWTPESRTQERAVVAESTSTGAPELQTDAPELQTDAPEPMIRTKDHKIEKNSSDKSSPAPIVAMPPARDGAAKEKTPQDVWGGLEVNLDEDDPFPRPGLTVDEFRQMAGL
ncbi:hypothetical protein [Microbacterium sp. 2RAF4]|uniref:hypothetical protein n=1 Tax=Microbacterium sp. 2RAF4 TaxID=3232999 RepID=UPI003F9651FF